MDMVFYFKVRGFSGREFSLLQVFYFLFYVLGSLEKLNFVLISIECIIVFREREKRRDSLAVKKNRNDCSANHSREVNFTVKPIAFEVFIF